MKIIKFESENFKRLNAVQITPDGNIVEITGRNGQGKTSILDAIWAVIAGADHIQAQPIRKGQTKARIRLNLGEVSVERRFTEKGTTLIVEDEKGARYTQPQTFLNDLFGELSFDPLAFVRMKAREQYEELRRVAPIEVDLDKLDSLNNADYHRRTEINRDAKSHRAQADALMVPEGLPEAKADVAGLLLQMEQASATNADIERRKGNRLQAKADIDGLRREAGTHRSDVKRVRENTGVIQLSDMQLAQVTYDKACAEVERTYKAALEANKSVHETALRRIEEDATRALANANRVEANAARLEAEALKLEESLNAAPPLPEPVDVAALRISVQQAQVTNIGITAREGRVMLLARADAQEKESANITATMEARDTEKARAIATAKMPVEGLGFGAGFVTFNAVPFEQASGAEQIRVSLAIAMALNPKLRVIRLQHGNDLDRDSFKMIADLANEKDYQIWIESVDETGKRGIVIEDGSVVAVNK